MTRSHVLLNCPNPKLRRGRAKAWEEKNPGGVRLLLVNSRSELRHFRFPGSSGVGMFRADAPDEDGAHAAKIDE
jgi:hypothetical protein